jgi:hypothetical protein
MLEDQSQVRHAGHKGALVDDPAVKPKAGNHQQKDHHDNGQNSQNSSYCCFHAEITTFF